MHSAVGVSIHDVASETGYNLSSKLLRNTTCTMYEEDITTIDANISNKYNVSILQEADIIQLLGRPIMTEEERLYRKILRRRPKMLELAAEKGLLCD